MCKHSGGLGIGERHNLRPLGAIIHHHQEVGVALKSPQQGTDYIYPNTMHRPSYWNWLQGRLVWSGQLCVPDELDRWLPSTRHGWPPITYFELLKGSVMAHVTFKLVIMKLLGVPFTTGATGGSWGNA